MEKFADIRQNISWVPSWLWGIAFDTLVLNVEILLVMRRLIVWLLLVGICRSLWSLVKGQSRLDAEQVLFAEFKACKLSRSVLFYFIMLNL